MKVIVSPKLTSEEVVPSVTDIVECESFAFAIEPASSSFETPPVLIVTDPDETEKLSVEKDAIPLLVALAGLTDIVTVPLSCEIAIPSSAVKVIDPPRLTSEEVVPSVTDIFECESFFHLR